MSSTFECYEIIRTCRRRGIDLTVVNGRIRVSGDAARDEQLLSRIKSNREDLIDFLEEEERAGAAFRGTFTRSDFPWADASDELIGSPEVQNPSTEDLYIATPMQAGLLFHGLLDGSGESYTSVTSCELTGNVDAECFRKAWAHVVQRHTIFRTCLVGMREKRLHQLVRRRVDVPLKELDWRDTPHEERVPAVQRFLAEDKGRGFDFSNPPLMRLTLIRLEDERFCFVWTHHHVLMDGWCLPIVFKEVMVSYRAFVHGGEPALPEPIPFVNYIAWIRRQDEAKARAFWKEYLSGVLAPTPLAVATRPSGKDAGEPRTATLEIDKAVTSKLEALARATRTTMSSIVRAAWALLLHRYSGEDDVVFGATVAGRPAELAGIEQMMGLFINTLPVRVRLDRSLTLGVLLHRIHEDTVACDEHCFLALTEVQQATDVPNGIPLFDSVIVFENYPTAIGTGVDRAAGLGVGSVRSDDHTNYSLTLLARHQGRLSIDVDHWSACISEASVRGLVGHLERILVAMADGGADQLLTAIDILTPAERELVLHHWNETGAAFSEWSCAHELFEEQVQRTPESIAVRLGEKELTYGELNRRSNRLAWYLMERGVGPDTLVGLCVERSLGMLIGILGILKAGGAYVALDPDYPAARLEYMVRNAGTRIVVAQSGVVGILPRTGIELVTLDDEGDAAQLEGYGESDPVIAVGPRNLAYVLYTSGSTGKPKGVMVEHRALVNRLEWMQKRYPLGAEDKVLQKTPFSFDVSVWELLWPVLVGAEEVFAKPGGHRDPVYLRDVIEEQGITTLHFVPSMLKAMLDTVDLSALKSLRRVFCSGEALGYEVVERFFQRMGERTELHNLYGPTEAAIDVTHWDCRDYASVGAIPIGRPIDNIQLYVLDESLQAQPIGVAGELHIGGVGLARGYVNALELTAEKFIGNPFSEDPASRLYKTGDLVRWRPDGNLEYLRRLDDQVKIRGFRIELGEIEQQLRILEGVKDCAVVCREDERDEKRLVGYVVPTQWLSDGGAEELAQRKRELVSGYMERLRASLPEYMVPAVIVLLEKLPLSSNGKLDRKALPAPEEGDLQKQAYVGPRNDTERALCDIWQQVLGLEQIGIHDSFFELGGDSLSAVKLIEKMALGGLRVDVRDLFRAPTIAQLTPIAAQAKRSVDLPENGIPAGSTAITPEMLTLVNLSPKQIARIVEQIPGGAVNIADIYSLLPLQEGMLFHYLFHGEGDAYLQTELMAFETRQRLDDVLEVLQSVIDRYDALRTAILWEGLAEPVQVVVRNVKLPIEEVTLDGSDVAAQLNRRFDPKHYRIDIRQAPLLRANVAFDAGESRWLLLLLVHHLVIDHSTIDTIRAEVEGHLRGQEGRQAQSYSFRNFVARARQGLNSSEHEAFFGRMLGDVSEPTAPFGILDTRGNFGEVLEARLSLSASFSRIVRARARSAGVSAASVFHLVWAMVLSRLTDKETVVFGTVLLGRMHGAPGVDQAVGLFMNTLPIRVSIDDRGLRESLLETHRLLGELLQHEHASLALAQSCSGVRAPTPLFTSLLNYRFTFKREDARNEPRLGVRVQQARERSNYPLSLTVDELSDADVKGREFVLTLHAVDDMDPKAIRAMTKATLDTVLDHLARAPQTKLRNLRLKALDYAVASAGHVASERP